MIPQLVYCYIGFCIHWSSKDRRTHSPDSYGRSKTAETYEDVSEAIRLLMNLDRQIYFDCPELPKTSLRFLFSEGILVSVRARRMDMSAYVADDLLVSDAIEVGTSGGHAKRVHRTAEEKRRIVEATLVPSASIARVALLFNALFQGAQSAPGYSTSLANTLSAIDETLSTDPTTHVTTYYYLQTTILLGPISSDLVRSWFYSVKFDAAEDKHNVKAGACRPADFGYSPCPL